MSAQVSDAVSDQLNVPGYVWKPIKSDSPVPVNAVSQNAQLDGDEAFIGRVRDGKYLYIGTAIPKRGICVYLDKDSSIKATSNYEVLTVELYHDAMFLDMDTDNLKIEELLSQKNLLPAGMEENGEVLYVARFVHDSNTYYGWLSKTSKLAYFPRDPKSGKQILDRDFGALTFIDVPSYCVYPPVPEQ